MYHGEKFNSITHLVGAIFALIGFFALLAVSIAQRDIVLVISFSVFGFTLILLYTASTLYHSLRPHKLKKLFQKIDHVSIYLLIAGTYTPYMLISLRDGNGPLLLVIVWALAIFGILLDLLSPRRIEILQIVIYLTMGWACIIEYSSLKAILPTAGLLSLTLGGIAYTVGIIFYVLDDMNRLRHAHGIWHLFVLLGSTCHFVSIIGFVR